MTEIFPSTAISRASITKCTVDNSVRLFVMFIMKYGCRHQLSYNILNNC